VFAGAKADDGALPALVGNIVSAWRLPMPESENSSPQWKKVYCRSVRKQVINPAWLMPPIWPQPCPICQQRTYQMRKLVARKMLQPIKDGARQNTLGFSNNYPMRSIVHALSTEGFTPGSLNQAATW
jgi:hypothetical protein